MSNEKKIDPRQIQSQFDVMSQILSEARQFIMNRGIYYYNSEMRGVGRELIQKIDAVTQERK